MQKQSVALIAIGANLPSAVADAGETLRTALHIVHENKGISISRLSKFWNTPAFPKGSGPNYLNGAFSIHTTLNPQQLIDYIKKIEENLGRESNTGRWSARVLDMDIIAFNDVILPDKLTLRKWVNLPLEQQKVMTPETLILPHPRMQDRGFVLAPLAEIAPDWIHPDTGKSVREMLDALPPESLEEMTPCSLQLPILP